MSRASYAKNSAGPGFISRPLPYVRIYAIIGKPRESEIKNAGTSLESKNFQSVYARNLRAAMGIIKIVF
jgi:hypothetical protein